MCHRPCFLEVVARVCVKMESSVPGEKSVSFHSIKNTYRYVDRRARDGRAVRQEADKPRKSLDLEMMFFGEHTSDGGSSSANSEHGIEAGGGGGEGGEVGGGDPWKNVSRVYFYSLN